MILNDVDPPPPAQPHLPEAPPFTGSVFRGLTPGLRLLLITYLNRYTHTAGAKEAKKAGRSDPRSRAHDHVLLDVVTSSRIVFAEKRISTFLRQASVIIECSIRFETT